MPAIDFETLHPDAELGTKEIAEWWGMSRRYLTNELTKRSDFPKPSTNISQKTRRWLVRDLLKFKRGG